MNVKMRYKKISIILLLLLISLSNLYAADSFTIVNNQIVFSLSSNDGIYHSATITKGLEKIKDIELCNKDRCLGKITPTTEMGELNGEYSLNYWVYDNYQRKTLDFTITANNQINTNQNSVTNSEQNSLSPTPNSFVKITIVATICRLSTLIKGDYQDCKGKYLY